MWMDPLISDEDREIVSQLVFNDLGFGFDAFGMQPKAVERALTVVRPIYEKYFRVESFGIENIPQEGATILASNHTGSLPIDGSMIGMDVFTQMDTPRMMRGVYDNFVGAFPFVNLMFSRMGQVLGTRRNFEILLENQEMVLVFPEGSKGIVKPFRTERYQCRKWNMGFIELHLKYKAPLVPIAVVGAEEQMPIMQENKIIGKPLGVNEVPITLNMMLASILGPGLALPFPSRYRIYYGKPIKFYEEFSEDAIRSPELVRELAREVQHTVQSMIVKGLQDRKGIFY